ncbi:hypothetical protein ABT297_38950 [Dactylosporangium sp. NPDC000555]|uniref:DivIVA domain-containing protein n=1 Tax=Dactylosporangium sp. NPDC000555 TaxID=3154260 RepID=UPI00331ED397
MTQNGMRQYDERMASGPQILNPSVEAAGGPMDQHKALQVLTMAQRTAEEHLEGARREADRIRGEAHAAATQIVSEAQARAESLREEAEQILKRARAAAVNVAREAEAFAAETERNANEFLAEAQNRAGDVVREAQANAYDIKERAEQIYEDVVGGLTSKRQALQQQIESLEQFDHEYRANLTSFMQQQMRALWVGQPQVTTDFQDSGAVAGELLPAARRDPDQHHEPDDEPEPQRGE